MSDNVRLLGIRRIRIGIHVGVWSFVLINMLHWVFVLRERISFANIVEIVVFDGLLWSALGVILFGIIDRRSGPPRPRWQVLSAGVLLLSGVGILIITLRATLEATLFEKRFATAWLAYFPEGFYSVTFYLALLAGTAFGLRYWALEERRRVTASELEAAVARAELRAAAGKLQPEVVTQSLSRISEILATDPLRAQRLLVSLGGVLHDSLARLSSDMVTVAEELESVERSLAFQREILPDGLRFTIEAGPGVRALLVPCFTLHTLVQRALRHCLDSRHGAIDLRVTVIRDGDAVRLAVHERIPACDPEEAPWRVELTVPAEAA